MGIGSLLLPSESLSTGIRSAALSSGAATADPSFLSKVKCFYVIEFLTPYDSP